MPLTIAKEKKPLENVKYVIGVAAGKGGVGKSTVAVNLARSLYELGYKVGLLDADVYGPSLRKMLPEETFPESIDGKLYPAKSEGIDVISLAYFREENEAAAVRAPIATSLINQFIKDIEWGHKDYLIIDFPPGTGDIQLTLCQQAHLSGVVMVTTPQEISALDVKKALTLFEKMHVPLLGLIENMSYFTDPATKKPLYLFGKGGADLILSQFEIPFLGTIPLEPQISLRADRGESIFMDKGPIEAVDSFRKIRDQLILRLSPQEPKKYKIHFVTPSMVAVQEEGSVPKHWPVEEIQSKCPCALCANGELKVSKKNNSLEASQLEWVGNYGFRLKFSSGCSRGLYTLKDFV